MYIHLDLMRLTQKDKCACVYVCDWDIKRVCTFYVFLCVLLTMLEEKKPRGSRQQGPADAGHPKMSRTNNSTRNSDASKINHISNSRNATDPAHRWGQKSLLVFFAIQQCMQLTAAGSDEENWENCLLSQILPSNSKREPIRTLVTFCVRVRLKILNILVIINWISFSKITA